MRNIMRSRHLAILATDWPLYGITGVDFDASVFINIFVRDISSNSALVGSTTRSLEGGGCFNLNVNQPHDGVSRISVHFVCRTVSLGLVLVDYGFQALLKESWSLHPERRVAENIEI